MNFGNEKVPFFWLLMNTQSKSMIFGQESTSRKKNLSRNVSSSKIGHNNRKQSDSKIEARKYCFYQKMVSLIKDKLVLALIDMYYQKKNSLFCWFFTSKIDFQNMILALFDEQSFIWGSFFLNPLIMLILAF